MKEHPILFSGPLVRAILSGEKTQTRRIIAGNPTHMEAVTDFSGVPQAWGHFFHGATRYKSCPYGAPGDRLWVRETFGFGPGGQGDVRYKADGADVAARWTSSIHMPRALSRLSLEVVGVRAQRLQDITEEDARAEGLPLDDEPCDHPRHSCADVGCMGPGYRSSFCAVWRGVYGPESWESNPWVWAVSFKRARP